ncbi:MAG: N-acetylmuramoyl-L-alanine amidase [Bacteroidia bacterium]|nr:N-acetylmuramoyl-L-alanine amidase [Bacteroidia bacterium]
MRINSLLELEAKFLKPETNKGFKLDPFSLPVPGENNLTLNAILASRKDGYREFYESEKTPKDKVVIHYTVGHILSDMTTLSPKPPTGKTRLSVAYVIARDGTIYQLFPSYYWSFHLGESALGGNSIGSKSSVAIELSNFGPLTLSPDKKTLETAYSRNGGNPVDTYCALTDADHYFKLDKPYRGYQYFAAHTDKQYDSLIILLRYLTATYQIPREFIEETKRFEATLENAQFSGISTHVNFRPTGKTDIGPAFDWKRVIDGVKAAQYQPLGTLKFGTMAAAASGGAAAASGLAKAGVFGSSAVAGPPPSKFPVFQNEEEMEKALIPPVAKSRGGFFDEDFGPAPEEEMEVESENRFWVD